MCSCVEVSVDVQNSLFAKNLKTICYILGTCIEKVYLEYNNRAKQTLCWGFIKKWLSLCTKHDNNSLPLGLASNFHIMFFELRTW